MVEGTYAIFKSTVVTNGSRTGGAFYDDGGLAYVDNNLLEYSKSTLDESLSRFKSNLRVIDYKTNFTGYGFKKGSPKIDLIMTSSGVDGNTWTNPLIFLGKDKTKINDDHELVSTLNFATDGLPATYEVNPTLYEADATYRAKIDSLTKGDLLWMRYDSDSRQIMKFEFIHFIGNEYDGSGDSKPVPGTGDTFTSQLNCSKDSHAYEYEKRMLLGNVVEVDPEYIMIQRAVDTQYTEVVIPKRVTVFKIDKDGEITEQSSSIASVYEGQKVICFFQAGDLSRIYIYEDLND